MSDSACVLIKVGGSLFDLPDLQARLRKIMAAQPGNRLFLFPGGGATADAVRDFDRLHQLGEESAHWLALRALTVNAYFLHALLPELPVALWPDIGDRAILEPYAFARADEKNPGHLPHSWSVTSDSLALRAACLLGAQEVILLKSTAMAVDLDWSAAAKVGFVDAYFPIMIKNAPGPRVRVANGRTIV